MKRISISILVFAWLFPFGLFSQDLVFENNGPIRIFLDKAKSCKYHELSNYEIDSIANDLKFRTSLLPENYSYFYVLSIVTSDSLKTDCSSELWIYAGEIVDRMQKLHGLSLHVEALSVKPYFTYREPPYLSINGLILCTGKSE